MADAVAMKGVEAKKNTAASECEAQTVSQNKILTDVFISVDR